MSETYQYKYAYIEDDGLCTGIQDSTSYKLNRHCVPIEDDTINYALKYYWPIPDEINSFDDWQGLWYYDAAHTQLFEEGNA